MTVFGKTLLQDTGDALIVLDDKQFHVCLTIGSAC
jgi:hypothetical protein